MAPIPEENQDKQSNTNNDDSDINSFTNSNQVFYGISGSSDDEDNYDNSAFGGYTLLPQDPEDEEQGTNEDNFISADKASENEAEELHLDDCSSLPEAAVLDLEMGATAPSVTMTNDSCHPAFLAKFVDGKVPSYLQVASISKDKDKLLWNQKSQDGNRISLDSAQESKILNAMSGFSLPQESIPDWANNLTDDQWHFQILKHIGVATNSEKHVLEQHKKHPEESSSSTSWVAEFTEKESNLTQ